MELWNQILYYMQQLCPAFWDSFFAGLPASPAVKCSRSMLGFFLSEVNTLRIGLSKYTIRNSVSK
jgi:hypothetical protein